MCQYLKYVLNTDINTDGPMRRKLVDKNIRKIQKNGHSYAITIPIEMIKELKWKEKQKVVVKKRGKGITVVDWK